MNNVTKLAGGVVAVGVVAVASVLLYDGFIRKDEAEAGPAVPTVFPREYVYLDSSRIATYLSQVTGGLSKSEQKTLSQSRTLTVGLSAGGGALGGSSQNQSSVLENVSPTSSSQFLLLRSDLLGVQNYLHRYHATDKPQTLWRSLKKLQEGAFVSINRFRVVFPDYGLIFPHLRAPPSVPLRLFVGAGPRRVRLLLPLVVADVAAPDLFVGHFTVFGKLLKTVPRSGSYTDSIAVAQFRQALRRLGSKELQKIAFPKSSQKPWKKKINAVSYAAQQVVRSYTVRGPAAVIIPLAIFK